MHLFELQFSLDICPGVGLLDDMVVLFFSFLKNLHPILHSGCTNLPSHQHPLQHLLYVDFVVTGGLSDRCGVIPYYSFDLHFSDN